MIGRVKGWQKYEFLAVTTFIISVCASKAYGFAASNIVEDNLVAQGWIAQAMDDMWANVLNGPLYALINNLGIFFAIWCLVVFLTKFTKEWINDESNGALNELIWPLIVALLLMSNGALSGQATLALRNSINDLNNYLLNTASATMAISEAYDQVIGEVGAEAAIEALMDQCSGISDLSLQTQCYEQAKVQAEEIVAELPNAPDGWFNRFLEGVNNLDPGQAIAAPISAGIIKVLEIILIGVSVAVQWVSEVTLLIVSLLGPIAVGLTLWPVGQKVILVWLTGFYSIGLFKICYNLMVGLTASVIMNAEDNHPLIFALIIGLLSPVVSFVLTGFGAMATLNVIVAAADPFARKAAATAGNWGGAIAGSTARLGSRLTRAAYLKASSR